MALQPIWCFQETLDPIYRNTGIVQKQLLGTREPVEEPNRHPAHAWKYHHQVMTACEKAFGLVNLRDKIRSLDEILKTGPSENILCAAQVLTDIAEDQEEERTDDFVASRRHGKYLIEKQIAVRDSILYDSVLDLVLYTLINWEQTEPFHQVSKVVRQAVWHLAKQHKRFFEPHRQLLIGRAVLYYLHLWAADDEEFEEYQEAFGDEPDAGSCEDVKTTVATFVVLVNGYYQWAEREDLFP